MNTVIPGDTEHATVWLLIPWLANGRLGEPDLQRVTAHLLTCADCCEELALQRQIHAVMAAPVSVDQIPAASLNKFRQRLDRVAAGAEYDSALRPRVRRAAVAQRPRIAIAAALAAALALAGLLGLPALRSHRAADPAPREYRTVTSDPSPQHGAVIRAVFQSSLTLAQLQDGLIDARLQIVAGPTESGVYSLAMNGSDSVEWSLQRLRAHDWVRFAEPLAATGP